MDLCHWIKAHPEILSVILFTDEVSFTRDGINNSRNLHTWSHDNPYETSVNKFQRRFSVNVWCGVLGNMLIRPFVFDNNLTGNTYEAFLRNELPGLLEDASATQSLLMRAENCIAAGGGHVEKLLYFSTVM